MSDTLARARAALERLGLHLEREHDATWMADVLTARAGHLHQRQAPERADQLAYQLLVAERGGRRIAFPLDVISEARRVSWWPLPRATPVVRGIFHVRTRPVSLVDIAALLDNGIEMVPSDRARVDAEQALVVVVACPRGALGVWVDALEGTREVSADDYERATSRASGNPLVAGRTRDLVTVIDVAALCAHRDVSIHVSQRTPF